uniref:Secreted protein n=1 Tax=Ditylenchus dipsaci TaxID=166011 RepID=A0A915EFF1_9BILA
MQGVRERSTLIPNALPFYWTSLAAWALSLLCVSACFERLCASCGCLDGCEKCVKLSLFTLVRPECKLEMLVGNCTA